MTETNIRDDHDDEDWAEPQTIARQNREGEVTVHVRGTVTEWITSTVSFDRCDRGKIRENRIAAELDR